MLLASCLTIAAVLPSPSVSTALVEPAASYFGGSRCAFDEGVRMIAIGEWKNAVDYFEGALHGKYRVAEASYGIAEAQAMLGEREAALDALERAFEAGLAEPTCAYSERRFELLRTDERFRELLSRYARSSELTIVPDGEPGEPLIVQATVRSKRDGEPVPGAHAYVYQTDSVGKYSRPRSDWESPRLFGYLESCPYGRFELRSVRPASYPKTKNPRHIHYRVTADGFLTTHGEILFGDDPLLDDERRSQALANGWTITNPARIKTGAWLAKVVIDLEPQPTGTR